MNRLLTQEEVCALLRIHYSTLRRVIRTGELTPVFGGRRKLLFTSESVEALIQSRQQPSPTPPNIGTAQLKKEQDSYELRQSRAASIIHEHRINREAKKRNRRTEK